MSCYRIHRGASKTQRLKVEKNLSFLTLRCLKASFSWSQQKLQPRTSAWWISTKEVSVIITTVSFFILWRLQKSTIQFHSRSFKLQFTPPKTWARRKWVGKGQRSELYWQKARLICLGTARSLMHYLKSSYSSWFHSYTDPQGLGWPLSLRDMYCLLPRTFGFKETNRD